MEWNPGTDDPARYYCEFVLLFGQHVMPFVELPEQTLMAPQGACEV